MNALQPGVVHVYTGDGKGKTTAALGLALRASGYHLPCCMIQFIKGTWRTGEMESAKLLPNFELITLGKGFVGIGGDTLPKEEHAKAAMHALEVAGDKIRDPKLHLLILDEINVAIHLGLIPLPLVLNLLDKRPHSLNMVLTGRNARAEIMAKADLVTEMKLIKHYFDRGLPGLRGIEY